MKNKQPKIIICRCHYPEHQLIIREDELDQEAYIAVHLTKQTLLRRIKLAFKYIFGYKCDFGAFEEVIIDKENTTELYNMLREWHDGENKENCKCKR